MKGAFAVKKDIFFGLIILSIVAVFIANVDIKTVDEYYNVNPEKVSEDSKTITLYVQCKDIIQNISLAGDSIDTEKVIDGNGIILSQTTLALCDDDTVFDVLSRCLSFENISFDFSGNPHSKISPAYISSIDGIGEFSCGKASGWQYSVNGISADKSCDEYTLCDGDAVEFSFVCDYTEGGKLI